ncbi:hypothetical protein [Brevundimonas sp. LM2]|uniref:hypothetical protein n=1 Tax=Brevundimonas sp. LM2 TaxID=1938605 RepID=UPI00209A909F|nr:hypothetical protein [Brevundimonas sp. LM2]
MVAFALIVTWRTSLLAYPLPVSWGLLGVFVAERAKGNETLAYGALAASGILLALALLITLGLRQRHPSVIHGGG